MKWVASYGWSFDIYPESRTSRTVSEVISLIYLGVMISSVWGHVTL